MPLTLLQEGQSGVITRIGGKPETRKFLEGLGFVAGATVTVVSTQGGNLICLVKEARVAISSQIASKVFV